MKDTRPLLPTVAVAIAPEPGPPLTGTTLTAGAAAGGTAYPLPAYSTLIDTTPPLTSDAEKAAAWLGCSLR